MSEIELITDGFTRVADELPSLLDGLSGDQLLWRPSDQANSIGWLAWHIGRCEDVQMAPLAGLPQVWEGWRDRFGLPYGPDEMGYGQTSEQVGAFNVTDPHLLIGYYADVAEQTRRVVEAERDNDLDRVIDDRWDPPVTAAVRIVSVINDVTQHLGQIAYIKGLL